MEIEVYYTRRIFFGLFRKRGKSLVRVWSVTPVEGQYRVTEAAPWGVFTFCAADHSRELEISYKSVKLFRFEKV